MADQPSKEDKQLPASEKRLKQAAEEGNVPRSRDAGHLLIVGTGLAMVSMLGPGLADGVRLLLVETFRFDQRARDDLFGEVAPTLGQAAQLLWPLGGLLLAMCVAAILAGVIPGGFNLASKALGFKPSKISPMNGLKRIFSIKNLVEFLKLSALALALGTIGFWYASSRFPAFATLSQGTLISALPEAAGLLGVGFSFLLLLLLALAVFDVPFQWFRHRADLRMSREEARREHKEQEGDPQLRGHIRAKQREAARRRMLTAVPAADIVVANPTHYAVAIRYDEAAGGAPRVVAKGIDELAMRIQAIARESGVPVLEAPPLARALYAHVDLEQEIPQTLYVAVAQVLVYVYQLKRWVPGRSAAPVPPTELPVPKEMDPKNSEKGDRT
ncbi:MAG: flagellar type III secretion system protein FlhB [Lautropia sp.]|nr:flagellar type III secretion system protein FlhB [Lautropia sp.]